MNIQIRKKMNKNKNNMWVNIKKINIDNRKVYCINETQINN